MHCTQLYKLLSLRRCKRLFLFSVFRVHFFLHEENCSKWKLLRLKDFILQIFAKIIYISFCLKHFASTLSSSPVGSCPICCVPSVGLAMFMLRITLHLIAGIHSIAVVAARDGGQSFYLRNVKCRWHAAVICLKRATITAAGGGSESNRKRVAIARNGNCNFANTTPYEERYAETARCNSQDVIAPPVHRGSSLLHAGITCSPRAPETWTRPGNVKTIFVE